MKTYTVTYTVEELKTIDLPANDEKDAEDYVKMFAEVVRVVKAEEKK